MSKNRLALAIVLALAALIPSAVAEAALTPGNTVAIDANFCYGPTSQSNYFRITASVADPSDANKISVASRVVQRAPSGAIVGIHQYPTVSTNLNHNTTSLTVVRQWQPGNPNRRTRIVDTIRFIHGNDVVASARRTSVAC
jgi:hypothetical protein